MAENIDALTPAWLCVFERNGERRHPEKPAVWVCTSGVEPGPDLDQHVRKTERWKSRKVTEVRYDLMPSSSKPGGRDNPFLLPRDKEASQAIRNHLQAKLKAEGFTTGKDLTTWRLYAIELVPPAKQSSELGWLYVGQTSLTSETRVEQHRLGPAFPWKGKPKHSRECHKRFLAPRLEIIPEPFRQTYYSGEAALTAEADLRLHFEGLGYEVLGGQERYEEQKLRPE